MKAKQMEKKYVEKRFMELIISKLSLVKANSRQNNKLFKLMFRVKYESWSVYFILIMVKWFHHGAFDRDQYKIN